MNVALSVASEDLQVHRPYGLDPLRLGKWSKGPKHGVSQMPHVSYVNDSSRRLKSITTIALRYLILSG